MVKRTYTTEQSGTSSTNRFVQRNYIPTKVVTGATTTPAKVQPNLTGKRKLPVPATDGDSQTGTMPDPINIEALTEEELNNLAKSGFTTGFGSPEQIAVTLAGKALGPIGSALVAGGTAMNIGTGRAGINMKTARDADFDFLNPSKELQDRQRDISKARKEALKLELPSLPDLRNVFNTTQDQSIAAKAKAEAQISLDEFGGYGDDTNESPPDDEGAGGGL